MMRRTGEIAGVFVVVWMLGVPAYGEQVLTVKKVKKAPVVDGVADDVAWKGASEVVTRDECAGVDIRLKAVHAEGNIHVLAIYPDADESREHKTLIWNEALGVYRDGPEREDTFILKWGMNAAKRSLSIYADEPHEADIWFWKACRTDPSGYADDKRHVLSNVSTKDSRKIISKNGKIMFLARPSDAGRSAYNTVVYAENEGARMDKYTSRSPEGSRADVKAKGIWEDGAWTIEFARAIQTGHGDDLQFEPGRQYDFGACIFEIAGRPPNRKLSEPLYGAGDVSEAMILLLEE